VSCEIEIVADGVQAGELRDLLQAELPAAGGVTLAVRREPTYRIGVETAVLVAAATAAGAAISAIINGLFKVLEKRMERKAIAITVQSARGDKIEVRGDATPERVNELIQMLGEMERVRIRVVP
jgi:hypothetical protein